MDERDDVAPAFVVGDRVKHDDGWCGRVSKVVARKVFGIEKDGGGYYVAQRENISAEKE